MHLLFRFDLLVVLGLSNGLTEGEALGLTDGLADGPGTVGWTH
jgi:hypothetical protein